MTGLLFQTVAKFSHDSILPQNQIGQRQRQLLVALVLTVYAVLLENQRCARWRRPPEVSQEGQKRLAEPYKPGR